MTDRETRSLIDRKVAHFKKLASAELEQARQDALASIQMIRAGEEQGFGCLIFAAERIIEAMLDERFGKKNAE